MKILSCSVQVSATVLLVTICGWILAGVASATNLPEERSQIISVFREAVRLNEEFKASVKTADPSAPHQSEYQEKRKAFEQYSADVLASRLDECVKVLSSNRDVELAKEFFNLLIGLENSANEMLSYSMGTIFLSNPRVILETFPKFSVRDQQYLYRKLERGWQNVESGQKEKNDARIVDRNKRLRQLRKQLF